MYVWLFIKKKSLKIKDMYVWLILFKGIYVWFSKENKMKRKKRKKEKRVKNGNHTWIVQQEKNIES